jgi:hypothetical protein
MVWGIEFGGCVLGVDLLQDPFEMLQQVGPIDKLTLQDIARRSLSKAQENAMLGV